MSLRHYLTTARPVVSTSAARTGARSAFGTQDSRSLHLLLDEIHTARSAQQAQQGGRGMSADAMASAQWATLRALEDFAAALEERHWPVPRQILQDLRLHRALCGLTRDGRARP